MSEVTAWIRQWRAGELSRAQLIDRVTARRWPAPAQAQVLGGRWEEPPASPYQYEDGTWSELDRARDRHLIPHDLYVDIYASLTARLNREG